MHVDDLRDASRERLLAEIGALQHQFHVGYGTQVNDLTNQVKDLEMALLKSRDHSRGLAAQVGELIAANGELIAANDELSLRIKQLRKAHERALNSPTWRTGRMVLLPVRVLKRLIKAS
jgi:hypothetical protein